MRNRDANDRSIGEICVPHSTLGVSEVTRPFNPSSDGTLLWRSTQEHKSRVKKAQDNKRVGNILSVLIEEFTLYR